MVGDEVHVLSVYADVSVSNINDEALSQIVVKVVGEVLSEPANLSDKTLGGILWHLFSRFFHKNTQTATAQKTYKANGSTVLADRVTSDDGVTQIIGKAS